MKLKILVLSLCTLLLFSCKTTTEKEEPNQGFDTSQISIVKATKTLAEQKIDADYTMLVQEQYNQLEEKFEDCFSVQYYVQGNNEAKCINELKMFARYDPKVKASLENWNKKSPQSYLAKLALFKYYSNAAWQIRGHGFSSSVPAQEMDQFRSIVKNAQVIIDAAIQQNPEIFYGYFEKIASTGFGSKEEFNQLIKDGLKHNPASAMLRVEIINKSAPRWGGNYEFMQSIVDDAQQFTNLNANLAKLQFAIELEKARDYMDGPKGHEVDYAISENYFKKAKSYNLYPSVINYHYSVLLQRTNQIDKRNDLELSKINEDPYEINPYINVRDYYKNQKRNNIALDYALLLYRLNPNTGSNSNYVGTQYEALKDYKEALKYYRISNELSELSQYSYRNTQKMLKVLKQPYVDVYSDREYLAGIIAKYVYPQRLIATYAQAHNKENPSEQKFNYLYNMVAVDEFEQAIKNALIMSEYTIKEFSMFVSALAEMQSYPGRLYKTSYGKENQVYFSEDEQGIKEFESLSGLVYSQWANIFNKNLEMQSKNGGS